jgi:hypothetical protein
MTYIRAPAWSSRVKLSALQNYFFRYATFILKTQECFKKIQISAVFAVNIHFVLKNISKTTRIPQYFWQQKLIIFYEISIIRNIKYVIRAFMAK